MIYKNLFVQLQIAGSQLASGVPRALALFVSAAVSIPAFGQTALQTFSPSSLPKIATVDERFQGYNLETIEITGGRFWKPYTAVSTEDTARTAESTPQIGNMTANLFMYRPPIDLSNKRLRILAKALGPAYIRISGSWQNATYFHDEETPAPKVAPVGFNGILTRNELKEAIEFAKDSDAQLITSVATSMGARDKNGIWTSDQASHVFNYIRSIGGNVAATEFMNEPTLARMSGVPNGYDAEAYARDVSVFRSWLKKTSPETKFLGPGGEGEGMGWRQPASMQRIPSEELLRATGSVYDAYTFHFYSAISSRCSKMLGGGVTPSEALSPTWFAIPDKVYAFYSQLRDTYMPNKPIWVTETGEAACGGDHWASTFLDTFRYLNELGSLARHGVKVVAHNTLVGSDYGFLDGDTFKPQPDYWAALLWHKFMGTTVLDAGRSSSENLYFYAHCLRNEPEGVAVLAINAGAAPIHLNNALPAEAYVLSAPELQSKSVSLNGNPLNLTADNQIPAIVGKNEGKQALLNPHTITFLLFRSAHNSACKLDNLQ
jgi:hypothetical protein